jgi:hypothetical protein
MKKTIAITYILSAAAYAGSGVGGGTPPALQDLEQILNVSPELDGGLFDYKGDLGLLTKIKLQPQMLVSGGSIGTGTPPLELDGGTGGVNPPIAKFGGTGGGSTPPLLKFSPEDVTRLRDRTKPIEAVGSEGQNLSFDVLPGDTIDAVSLKDRRLIMREAIK